AFIQYGYHFQRLEAIAYPYHYQNDVRFHYGGPEAEHNRVGRLYLTEDATGGKELFYGPLGETTKSIRTVVINDTEVRTFIEEFMHDSWGRIQEQIYADGEVVSYHYDRGGKLNRMDSRHLDFEYTYISEILYDKFEQRTSITYGNGAATTYSYDPERRWLEQMQASSEEAGQFCNMQYGFDLVGNITSLDNLAEQTNVPGGIGGRYSHSYEYDPLYRLISAQGQWTQAGLTSEYGLDMGYDNLHNIEFKSQRVTRNGLEVNDQTYDREYLYDQDRPHLPSRIGDFAFTADANGNLTSQVNQVQLQNRRLIWDEENRLQQVNDGGYISQNTFDASGIRTIKSHGPGSGVTIDGTEVG
ncbi:MAG: hypothetical protein AAFO91_17900, partial [Bacteroidota bacterium]